MTPSTTSHTGYNCKLCPAVPSLLRIPTGGHRFFTPEKWDGGDSNERAVTTQYSTDL